MKWTTCSTNGSNKWTTKRRRCVPRPMSYRAMSVSQVDASRSRKFSISTTRSSTQRRSSLSASITSRQNSRADNSSTQNNSSMSTKSFTDTEKSLQQNLSQTEPKIRFAIDIVINGSTIKSDFNYLLIAIGLLRDVVSPVISEQN